MFSIFEKCNEFADQIVRRMDLLETDLRKVTSENGTLKNKVASLEKQIAQISNQPHVRPKFTHRAGQGRYGKGNTTPPVATVNESHAQPTASDRSINVTTATDTTRPPPTAPPVPRVPAVDPVVADEAVPPPRHTS